MKSFCRSWVGALCATGVLTATPAFAQVNGLSFSLFPWAGYANLAKNVNIEDEPGYGAKFGVNLHRYVSVEGNIGRFSTETVHGFTLFAPETPPAIPSPQEVDMLEYGADVVVNLRPSAWFNPYLVAGWQEARFEFADETAVPKPMYENGVKYGGGVKMRLSPRFSIRGEFRNDLWKFAEGTPPPAGTDGTDNQFYTAGIEMTLGGTPGNADADQDGVPDSRDDCPDTPVSAHVDEKGCPTDADQDGIPDGIDMCANTPTGARVDARGCPADVDSDGVPDGVDQCADTPAGAVVDARGCPKDSDSDGVPDGIDQCADTKTGAQVDARGCVVATDADGDGVSDDADLCPYTPANARVDKDGCPIELSSREVELLDQGRITEREIHFETAKWDILPQSHRVLDEIGRILIQWPRLMIEIGGHADYRGSDEYNRDLSEKRSNSVMQYLLQKFPQLDRSHFSARGYGESMPVATNKTVEGMAMNRRVEFKVMNPEELRRERERRELLKQGSN